MTDRDNPELVKVVDGWAAVGDGWAVVGVSRDDAVRRFREAEALHRDIASRPAPDVESEPCPHD
jgi:hypothetical protein